MILKKYPPAILALVLAVLVLAIYWQTTGFELINLDDIGYIYENPAIREGLKLTGIKEAFTEVLQSYWLPATWISYMADVSVWGFNPAGFHRTNVILHLLNALLLFLVLRSATGSIWKSFFAAALWAVHPLRAESVAWVAERKDVLSGFFFLLAIWAHIKFTRTKSRYWQAAIAGFAALGMMAKPIVIVLPLALLLLDFWPLGRFPEGGFRERLPGLRKLFLEKAHLYALSVIFLAATADTQVDKIVPAGVRTGSFSLGGFLGHYRIGVKAYWAYLYETVWPVGLYLRGEEYDHSVSPPLTALLIALLVLVSVLAWKYRKSLPWLAFGWFWYLLVLFPTSGVVQAGINTFSDRFTYLPHIGLLVAAVWGAESAYGKFFKETRPLIAAGTAVTILLAALSFNQVSLWKDDLTFFTHIEKMSGGKSSLPKKPFAVIRFNEAVALYKEGKYREAAEGFAKALSLNPKIPKAGGYMGISLANLGRYREAAELLRKELELAPGDREFSTRLANILILAGDLPGAARQALENIRQWPSDAEAWQAVNYLGGEARARSIAGMVAGEGRL